MIPEGGLFRGLLIGGMALTLHACVPAQVQVPPRLDVAFPQRTAVETFSTGFASIHGKYLHDVGLDQLTTDGLRGLAAIDPDLDVTAEDGALVLTAKGAAVARFPRPPAEDVDRWAALAADATAAGRGVSDALHEASLERVYEAVFDGALSGLDAFSRYAGAEDAQDQRARREGYSGVGLRLRFADGVMRVVSVTRETPAARAGIRIGDRITHIDDVPTVTMSANQAENRLRGPDDSRVHLTVERDGAESMTVAMQRTHIYAATTLAHYLDGMAIIRVTSFNQDTARSVSRRLEDAHRDLGADLQGIILDLRGNPGGVLKQAIRVADLFLVEGAIISTRGRHPDSVRHYQAGGRDLALGLPIVVLVDGKSASAAEIVAAALQDRGRAVVIGTNSFGKGTVQTVIRLPNDGELTLTWSRLVTPSGYLLHGLGVHPSICTTATTGSSAEAIRRWLANSRTRTSETMQAWRRIGVHPDGEVQSLRQTCPAEAHRAGIDMDIARALIADRALYIDAIDQTTTATAARE